LGANDYIVKLPDRLELVARVKYHSRGYTALVERNEAFAALQKSQQVLAHDLATAAHYVRSLLPPPQTTAGIRADWRFIPSASLGGDAFGYHDLDPEHFAVYLLDVCGHGVGAALLSVSALSAIRSQALPADFRDPAAVLGALNRAFPMERHNEMFFTAWYGVFHRAAGRLRWAGGGHPPALLLAGEGGSPRLLESEGPLVGAVDGVDYTAAEVAVPAGSRLFVYSDGAFEISLADGSMWPFADFVATLSREVVAEAEGGATSEKNGGKNGQNKPASPLDGLLGRIRDLSGRADFHDDFSMVELAFG
jgi:sigma-B regulation protein RsbU (phosphoserine phosphatase)